MAEQLDVYRDWLGIMETARPLNYYQLLRVKQFEDDAAKIRANYRKMNAHVRKYATGDYARQSQELLNELARAMLCLTDAQRKREYDAGLGREEEDTGRRRSLEEILLARKVIDQAQLEKARSYADAVGLEVRDALLQQKMATADVVMLAYAESQGLPYIELSDIGIDENLVARIPPGLARKHSFVPVMVDENQMLMASPNSLVPDVEEELRLRLGMPVRTVLCTATSVHAAVQEHFPHDAPEPAPVSKGKSKAVRKKPAKAKKEPEQESEPQTEFAIFGVSLPRKAAFAIVGFNTAVIAFVVLMNLLRQESWNYGAATLVGLAALLIGALGAGAGYLIANRME